MLKGKLIVTITISIRLLISIKGSRVNYLHVAGLSVKRLANIFDPQKRAHCPQLAAGLASELEID
jgi:hypothetical protein